MSLLIALVVFIFLPGSLSASTTPRTQTPKPRTSTPITVGPSSVTFPFQAVGTTSPAVTVMLANYSGANGTLSSITVTGDFAETNNCGTVIQQCYVYITFTPTAVGTRTGTLTITDGASNSPQIVPLSGSGWPGGAGATTASIASSGAAGSYSLTGTVSGIRGNSSPTGSVSFIDTSNNNLPLGTGTLGTAALSFGLANGPSAVTGLDPSDVAVGDFNGDGKPDLAIANDPGLDMDTGTGLTILLGKGDGTFQAAPGTIPASAIGTFVATGDFNGDGKVDLVTSGANPGTLTVLLGNGDGTFTVAPSPSISNSNNIATVAVGDFNGDGKADIAITNNAPNGSGGGVTILLGIGDGTFTSGTNLAPGIASQNLSSVVIADFNGDGKADLAALNSIPGPTTTTGVTVWLGNGDGTFQTPISANLNQFFFTESVGKNIAVGDFNGDGKPDLVVEGALMGGSGTATSDGFVLLTGNGNGSFVVGPSIAVSPSPSYGGLTGASNSGSVAVTDFNGDGKPDIVILNEDAVNVLLNNGDGTFTSLTTVDSGAETSPNWLSMAVADFNADGMPDFVTVNSDALLAAISLGQRTETATASLANVSVPGSGNHNVVANYLGDSNFAASTSAPVQLTGTPVSTSLTLNSSASSSSYGAQLALTATLSPSSAGSLTTNGETVTFSNNGTSIGTATLTSGVATLNTTSLPVGTNSLTASYAGDTNFGSASSSPVSVAINESIQLSASAPSVAYNGTVTLTATANPAISGGKWWIYKDGTDGTIAQNVIANGAFPNASSNGFTITTLPLSVGTHTFYAYYSATAPPNNIPPASQLALTSVNVTQAVSTTSLTSSATSVTSGTSLTFTATVASTASGTPTGTVQFLNGATVLGSGALSSGGVATLSTSTLAVGTYNITAAYSGDTNYASSTSAAVAVTVTAPPLPALTLSSSSLTFASQTIGTTSTAQTVTLTNSGQAPLTLTSIAASGDFAQTNNCGTSVAVGATCTISTTFTPTASGSRTGALTITDNANNSPQTVALTGTGIPFTVTPGSNTLTISSVGGSTTATIQIAPAGGFTGTVNLTCVVNYQGQGTPNSPPTCSLTPSQVQVTGTSPISATLTVTTTAASASLAPGWMLRSSGVAFAAFFLVAVPRKRWRGGRILAVLCLVALGGMMGCSSGNSSSNSTNPGTTVGSYSVVVTATSGSVSASTTVPLTLQ